LTHSDHRTTLLNTALREVGVGVVVTPDNSVFLIEDLLA
jgi:uncharacterized protein YkwD